MLYYKFVKNIISYQSTSINNWDQMLSETCAWEKVPTGYKTYKDGDKIHQLQNIVYPRLNTKGNIQCFCCMNNSLYIQWALQRSIMLKKNLKSASLYFNFLNCQVQWEIKTSVFKYSDHEYVSMVLRRLPHASYYFDPGDHTYGNTNKTTVVTLIHSIGMFAVVISWGV